MIKIEYSNINAMVTIMVIMIRSIVLSEKWHSKHIFLANQKRWLTQKHLVARICVYWHISIYYNLLN